MPDKNYIQDVAPWLADIFVDDSTLDEKTNAYFVSQQEQMIKQNAQRLGKFAQYLLSILHDSDILSARFEDGDFVVVVDDICTNTFASIIRDEKGVGIDKEKRIFPLEIRFEKARVLYYNVKDDGEMNPIELEPTPIDVYYADQLLAVTDETIHLGLAVWKRIPPENCYFDQLFLEITAKAVSVTERQEEAWRVLFGGHFLEEYHYFQQQFAAGRPLNSDAECQQVYDEFQQQKPGFRKLMEKLGKGFGVF